VLRNIVDLSDAEIQGKKIFLRVDFNVSINNGAVGQDYRIRMAIPTIEYLVKRGAIVILASHLGKPTQPDSNCSLRPVSRRLSQIMRANKVMFVNDCVGNIVHEQIDKMKSGEILLLENLRFHKEEECNDLEFSQQLSSLADIYVNDAFSVSHRKHASIYGAAKFFDIKLSGLNLKKEIEYLSNVRENPINPFILLIGGIKIKDKIGALENLLPKADKVLLGGGTAFTFLKASGIPVGNSPVENEYLPWAANTLSEYNDKIMLPEDHIVSDFSVKDNPDRSPSLGFTASIVKHIPDCMSGYDIGIETVLRYLSEICGDTIPGTIFWNGPMGLFEIPQFANGTVSIARDIALAFWRGSQTLIGGGDTIEGLKVTDVSEREVSHVSTGGGATLKFLAGNEMPGLDILEN
jgi:phosphoglycerate kinase